MDRTTSGERLGQCPTCGGHKWWDNRARKAAGELGPSAPDYVCESCRHGRWDDGREAPGRSAARRTPAARVTVVPAEAPPPPGARGAVCAAAKRDGTPCRNGAMAGSAYCGPHAGVGGAGGGGRSAGDRPPNACQGTTKAGTPCRAGAVRGERYCPQHAPDREPGGGPPASKGP